jgi:hypothetical protein
LKSPGKNRELSPQKFIEKERSFTDRSFAKNKKLKEQYIEENSL